MILRWAECIAKSNKFINFGLQSPFKPLKIMLDISCFLLVGYLSSIYMLELPLYMYVLLSFPSIYECDPYILLSGHRKYSLLFNNIRIKGEIIGGTDIRKIKYIEY